MADACDRLALEHLTAPAASPLQLVELAASEGWAAATVLLSPFAAFPETAGVDLVGDPAGRGALRRAATDGGVALVLAYPFVLTRRTAAADFGPALEAAAEIGARGVGLLVYDRDPARAADQLDAFCDRAAALQLRPVLEFFGGSAAPTLEAADALAAPVRHPPALCVDLLHLVRSGGRIADLAGARAPVVHAQLSDAPLSPPADLGAEAARGRLGPGEGGLDLAGFVAALPPAARLGLEVPPPEACSDTLARARRLMRTTRASARGWSATDPDRG